MTSKLPVRPILTHSAAKRMIDAALAKAEAEGWKMHIAIVDANAGLLAYARMDDSLLLSQQVAMLKAETAVKLQGPSDRMAAYAFGDKGPGPLAFLPGLAMMEGGLPIVAGAALVGGIGVSGSSAANDRACAEAAIAAIAEQLAG